MTQGRKFVVGALFTAAAIGYLAFLGAASSWQYYLSVDETVANRARLLGKRLRVSGNVEAGSLSIREDRRHAKFELQGDLYKLFATCNCALPDNLAENIDVVVEGILHDDGLHGHKVITRCASKYESKDTLQANQRLSKRTRYESARRD